MQQGHGLSPIAPICPCSKPPIPLQPRDRPILEEGHALSRSYVRMITGQLITTSRLRMVSNRLQTEISKVCARLHSD